MEAITVCQSKYKIIIVINNGTKSKVTSITIMTGKGTETRNNNQSTARTRKSAAGGQIRSERGLMRFGEASGQSPGQQSELDELIDRRRGRGRPRVYVMCEERKKL